MKTRRHRPEEIIVMLRRAEALLSAGATVSQACRALAIAEPTFYRWRSQFDGMNARRAKRLGKLEQENARLTKQLADLTLDNQMLRELSLGKW